MMTLRSTLWVMVLAAVPGLAMAQEQAVKPYVMLLFDTSGSMANHVCSTAAGSTDNSIECPGSDVSCSTCDNLGCGDHIANDSKIWKVKTGATNVVSAFGEVTFGLSRFHQTSQSFACPAGGWNGAGTCGNTTIGTSYNRADVLVGFSPTNQTDILRWLNSCKDYPVGTCGGTGLGSNNCSLCTNCGSLCCGTGCDYELRPDGNTPLAGSMYSLRTSYFPGVLSADTKKDCRPYILIALTDGVNNCKGDPVAEATTLHSATNNLNKAVSVRVIGFSDPKDSSLQAYLDQISNAGSGKPAILVDNEVSLALAMANIISESLLKEECNGIDDDCDGDCDENWPEVAIGSAGCANGPRNAQTCTAGIGACQRSGVFVCKADHSGSQCNATPASPTCPGAAGCNAQGEICGNNIDDDCDGQIDEGCVPCVAQPEICDGKDNNCNGLVDEGYVSSPCGSDIGECKKGMSQCVGGQVICNGAVPPTAEICDGKDNNCDTIIDNFSEPCYPPATGCDLGSGICAGICQLGFHICTNATWGSCIGWNGPSPEICNGVDDDCDGIVDNVPGLGQACGNDVGECKQGTLACVQQAGGLWASVCQGEVGPTPEICDGKDNDCDGQIDEDFPEKGKLCGKAVGECKAGTWQCQNGALVCAGEVGKTPEVCDGKDNDCNGIVDDNVPGDGQPCGTDVGECKAGIWKCVNGKMDCQGGVGPTKEICDNKDNDCDGVVDQNAECPGGSVCVEGECMLPCGSGEFPCPGGTECKNGYCIPEKCANVTCKPTEHCVDGSCVEKCAGTSCKAYEKCDPTTGKCVDDSCFSKGCPADQTCIAYQCVANPCPPGKCPADKQCIDGTCYGTCLNVTCAADEVCVRGSCVKRSPCDGYPCSSGFICKVEGGQPSCAPDPCRIISCAKGQVCKDGTCIGNPCSFTTCPEGLICQVTASGDSECSTTEGVVIPTTRQILATGGGGCACRVGDGDARGGLLLPLLGLLLWATRRRRSAR